MKKKQTKKKGLSIKGASIVPTLIRQRVDTLYIWLRIVNIARLNFSTTAPKKSNTHNFGLALNTRSSVYSLVGWLSIYLMDTFNSKYTTPMKKKEKERTKQETKNGYRILLVV